MENTDRVLVTYQDGVNWKVGDTVVLHTTSGDKQVTIAGILATSTASAVNGAGSSGYMICSEQTFTALVGDLGYRSFSSKKRLLTFCPHTGEGWFHWA